MAVEPRNFLFNSDFPPDKILETGTGSFTAIQRNGASDPRRTTETIPHSIGTFGLINGAYSKDNSTWFPFGVTEAVISGGLPTFQTVEVNAGCDADNVYIVASNWLSSNQTIYYAYQILSKD